MSLHPADQLMTTENVGLRATEEQVMEAPHQVEEEEEPEPEPEDTPE